MAADKSMEGRIGQIRRRMAGTWAALPQSRPSVHALRLQGLPAAPNRALATLVTKQPRWSFVVLQHFRQINTALTGTNRDAICQRPFPPRIHRPCR